MKRFSWMCLCLALPTFGCSRGTVAAAPDQAKVQRELRALGVPVGPFDDVFPTAEAFTAEGDFKPGVAGLLLKLSHVRSVQVLDLPMFGVGAARSVAAIPGLTVIELRGTKATDAAISALGECPTLEELVFNSGSKKNPVVTDAGLAGLAKLKNVKRLWCEGGIVTSKGVAALEGFSKMEELNLKGSPLDDSASPHLAKLVSLTQLNVAGSKMTGKGITQVAAGATHLRHLAMDRSGITDDDIGPIAMMPELLHLSIAGTQVTDAGAATLSKSKSLQSLDIWNTKVTDVGIISLVTMPQLHYLYLQDLPLTDVTFTSLLKVPELRALYLKGNKFTDEGLAKFVAARPKVRIGKY